MEGSISTPFFQEPFDENSFKPLLSLSLYIYVPKSIKQRTNMSIVINVKYDVAEFSKNEYVSIEGKKKSKKSGKYIKGEVPSERLEKTERWARRAFIVRDDLYKVTYTRYIQTDINIWNNRRNVGMNVTWYYTGNISDTENKFPNDNKYLDDNKEFILLANLIHEKGPKIGENLLERSTSNIKNEKCYSKTGKEVKLSDEKSSLLAEYGNVSAKAVYPDVSDETLAMAAKIYFRLVFCPDKVVVTENFFQNLFENFPVESILKTLARLLYVAREKKLTEHYRTAMFFFNEITSTMNLTYKDIAVMTNSFSELQKYEDLKSHQVALEDLLRESSEVKRLISHPVDISDSRPSPSAFIPFCSLGGDLTILGRKSPRFSVPVCAAFREKIVGGQLCYQAQLNRYGRGRGVGWKETLQEGLSLVIDTNLEYDVKNLLVQNRNTKQTDPNTFKAYPKSSEHDSFSIILETIST